MKAPWPGPLGPPPDLPAVVALLMALALLTQWRRLPPVFFGARRFVVLGILSLTAAATLANLERSGPQRLTALAVREGVTQPAMTQLIARLQEGGLVCREADPGDGRVVQVRLTDQGRDTLARRRAVRAERLAVILDRISPQDRAALGAALPAIDALASVSREASAVVRYEVSSR